MSDTAPERNADDQMPFETLEDFANFMKAKKENKGFDFIPAEHLKRLILMAIAMPYRLSIEEIITKSFKFLTPETLATKMTSNEMVSIMQNNLCALYEEEKNNKVEISRNDLVEYLVLVLRTAFSSEPETLLVHPEYAEEIEASVDVLDFLGKYQNA